MSIRVSGALNAADFVPSNGPVGVFGKAPVAQQPALTAADAAAIDITYGAEEAGVLGNLRTRLNEVEARLRAYGFLP